MDQAGLNVKIDQCTHSVRALTIEDIPWILSLSHERYRPFDPGKALVWLINALKNQDMHSVRTDGAFCFSGLGGYDWFPRERECHVVLLCAAPGRHWEAITLLRASIAWGKERGCVRWFLNSDTDYDFAMLAKRVGATAYSMRYQLKLLGE